VRSNALLTNLPPRFTAQFPEQFWRGKPADRPAASVSITIQ
jgi:hypothetical protein